jgi:hypothetical protein
MSFTNDNLKRLKEMIQEVGMFHIGLPDGTAVDVGALLARLEAAEYAIDRLYRLRSCWIEHNYSSKAVLAYEAWCKAAGK